MAIASWLILQYRFNHNYPNVEVRTGTRLLLQVILLSVPSLPSSTLTSKNRFASCWTSLTAGAYSVMFLHSAWSKHPMASIGAQVIWIFVTWLFWIVGAGIINDAASSFLVHGTPCGPDGVVYCSQIRALFGALQLFYYFPNFYGIEKFIISLIRCCCSRKVHIHLFLSCFEKCK